MAKISSYSQITTPTNSDLLLGTDVGSDNKTKNFLIADKMCRLKKTIDNPKNYFLLIPNITFVLQQFYRNCAVALLQQIFSLDFSLFY